MNRPRELNAANLMYCEDAARRMKVALDQVGDFVDYRIQASHLESLHPTCRIHCGEGCTRRLSS